MEQTLVAAKAAPAAALPLEVLTLARLPLAGLPLAGLPLDGLPDWPHPSTTVPAALPVPEQAELP